MVKKTCIKVNKNYNKLYILQKKYTVSPTKSQFAEKIGISPGKFVAQQAS